MGKTVGEKRSEDDLYKRILVAIAAVPSVPSVNVRVRGIRRLEDARLSGRVVSRLALRADVIKNSGQTNV